VKLEHLAPAQADIDERGDGKESSNRCELVEEHLEEIA
jgi:hypothetical protein